MLFASLVACVRVLAVIASVVALIRRPYLVRTGSSLLQWRLTIEPQEALDRAYFVVGIPPLAFVVLAIAGALMVALSLRPMWA